MTEHYWYVLGRLRVHIVAGRPTTQPALCGSTPLQRGCWSYTRPVNYIRSSFALIVDEFLFDEESICERCAKRHRALAARPKPQSSRLKGKADEQKAHDYSELPLFGGEGES